MIFYLILFIVLLLVYLLLKDILWVVIICIGFILVYKFFLPGSINEGMTDKKKKTKKKSKKSKSPKKSKKKKKPKLNVEKTLLESYKNLTSDQVNGLNKDTKDLIHTQKHLMKTLGDMGPVLSQGKSIISAFESYFGGDNKDVNLPHNGPEKVDMEYISKMLDNKALKKK